ncbi:MAG: transglutaminase domain-containing protein [Verrucomicrobiae bacterium]|nr:transglutaminase domain-containing protein [Verrucomicrobiae bacterium]
MMVLTGILVSEAFLASAITGTGLHQALIVVAAVIFAGLRWVGPRTAAWSGMLIGILGLGVGGWQLERNGMVPVLLSDLPMIFHVAVALHFWMWTRVWGWGVSRKHVRKQDEPSAWEGWVTLVAGGIVFWATNHVEIYGSSVFGVRLMAVLVLAGGLWFAWSRSRVTSGSGPLAANVGEKAETSWRQRVGLGLFLIGGLLAMTAMVPVADRVALWSYAWLGRDQVSTELDSFQDDAPVVVSGGGVGDDAMRQLPRRADLHLDNSVRFHLWFDDMADLRMATHTTLYLRTSTMGVFTSDGGLGPIRRGEWIYDSDDGESDGITHLDSTASSGKAGEVEFWTLIRQSESRELPIMPATRSVGLTGVYAFADDWFQLALEEHQSRVRFRARAALGPANHWHDSEPAAKGDVAIDYLQLPDSPLTSRLLDLTRKIAPAGLSLDQRLSAVCRYLGQHCEYSLSYDNPDDLDPVENFLFDEKKGHCELFATGGAMLLRAIGVPARVAFGFSGGEYHPARRLIAFRQSDFHAWTEINLAGRGWVIFDTTPLGAGAAGPAERRASGEPFAAVEPGAFEDLSDERLLGQLELPWWSKWTTGAIEAISAGFVWLCLGAGVVVLGIYGWRRKRRHTEQASVLGRALSHAEPLPAEEPASSLLHEYLAACAAWGRVKGPAQTLGEYLAVLKQDGVCGDDFDELNAYLYRVRYAGGAPDSEREQGFRDLIRQALIAPEAER